MYPYPPPYPMPVQAPPPALPRTPSGLRSSLLALALGIGYFVAVVVNGLIHAGAFATFDTGGVDAVRSTFGALLVAGALLLVFGIIVLVLYFIGFGFLYGGRNEFGPAHARNVQISMILLILAIVIGVVQVAAVAVLNGAALRNTGFGFLVDAGMFYTAALVNAILGIAVAALVSAHLVLNVRELTPPNRQVLLYVAAATGTATPGVVGSLTLLQLPAYIDFVEALAEAQTGPFLAPTLDPAFGLPAIVAGVLGLVTFALYLWLYRAAGARIRTGELKPMSLPPPTPVAPWGPMPMYPAPPPAPPAPPSPPSGPG